MLMIWIIVRSIRSARRSTTREQPVTGEGSSFGREDIAPENYPFSEPDENRFEPEPPGELNRGSGDLNAGGTWPAAPPGCRQHQGRHREQEPFDDLVSSGVWVKGFVWSQILGPRGGVQATKKGLN